MVIVFAGCDRSPLSETALRGQITISNTDFPVKNAKIYLNDTLKARSDDKGNYSISGLSADKYLLTIKKSGYKPAEKTIMIEDTGDEDLHISLDYNGDNTASGKVSIVNRAEDFNGNSNFNTGGKAEPGQIENQTSSEQYKKGEIIVKYREKISTQQKNRVDSTYNLSQLGSIKRDRTLITRYRVPETKSIEKMIAVLEDKPEVEWAKPNYIYWTATKPADEKYPEQWGHAAANLEAAWDLETGSRQVTVAVLDTGIIMEHEEFISGDNVDDRGVSFAGSSVNEDPRDYEIYEKNPVDRTPRELGGSHGTHVSGIIGARANNTGVAGVNWKINILPI
ncbi:MAG: carboxypeptidase regulatory-like domain-containing protein, partial [Halanaerobiales bacterium]